MANTTKTRAMDHRNPQRKTNPTTNANTTNQLNPSAPSAPTNALSAGASLPAFFAIPAQTAATNGLGDISPKLLANPRTLPAIELDHRRTIPLPSHTCRRAHLPNRYPQIRHTRTMIERSAPTQDSTQHRQTTSTHNHPTPSGALPSQRPP
jgi:hypothetical protein